MNKIVLAVLLVFGGAGQAQAAEDVGEKITASPAITRYSLEPGGTVSGKVQITNQGVRPFDFTVSAQDFKIKNEDYEQSYRLPQNSNDTASWFKVTATKYHLGVGQQVDVPYTISVPKNASPGGHYAVLFAKTDQPEERPGTIVSAKQVGSLFLLTVNGDLQKAGRIIDFKSAFAQRSPKYEAALRMENTGNVHYDAEIRLTLTDVLGNIKFDQQMKNAVLPQTTRKFKFEWNDAPAAGLFKVGGSVKYLDRTEQLPSQYVLMMSPAGAIVSGVVFALVLGYGIIRRHRHRGPRR